MDGTMGGWNFKVSEVEEVNIQKLPAILHHCFATFTRFQIDLFEISLTTGKDSPLHHCYLAI